MRLSHQTSEGFTLIEILVTVMIMGIAIAAMLGAMSTSIVATDTHRNQSDGETVIRSYAEKVLSADMTYVNCATASPSLYSAPPTVTGFSAKVTAVEFWNGSSYTSTMPSACPGGSDGNVQRLTLEVTNSSDTARPETEKIDVVKRKTS